MAGVFKVGDEVEAINSKSVVKILELLGSGGQGEVYRVKHHSSELALKTAANTLTASIGSFPESVPALTQSR